MSKYQYNSPPQIHTLTPSTLDTELEGYLDEIINDSTPQPSPNRLPMVMATVINHKATWVMIGLFFGLVILGWWLWPVKWVDTSYESLTPQRQMTLLLIASDLYSIKPGNDGVHRLINDWPEFPTYACAMARVEVDPARRARLIYMAYATSGVNCE